MHRLDRYAIRLLLALPPYKKPPRCASSRGLAVQFIVGGVLSPRPQGLLPFGVYLSITYLTYISFFMLKYLVYIMSYMKSVSSVNFDTFNQRIAQPWDFSGLHNIALFAPPEYFSVLILFIPQILLARLLKTLPPHTTLWRRRRWKGAKVRKCSHDC